MVSSLSPQPVMDRPVPLASPVARRRHPALVPWIVLGLVAVLDAVWLTCAGVGLTATQLPSLLLRVALLGGLLVLGWAAPAGSWRARLGLLGETLLRFLALTTSAGILSYLVLTLHRPLIDPLLAQADAALGVPYMAWFVWVEAHPQVAEILTSAYLTTWLQLVVCLVVLALGQQRARLQELFWAIALALGVILPLSGAFPAQSAWVTYGLTARVPPWAMGLSPGACAQCPHDCLRPHAGRALCCGCARRGRGGRPGPLGCSVAPAGRDGGGTADVETTLQAGQGKRYRIASGQDGI